ncbi:MAG TPA: hypothetical protein VIP09_11790 [Dehalococcoidia bacterium]
MLQQAAPAVIHADRKCKPGCPYIGPPGTCPDHDTAAPPPRPASRPVPILVPIPSAPSAVTEEAVREVLAQRGSATASQIAYAITSAGAPVSEDAIRILTKRAGTEMFIGKDGQRRYRLQVPSTKKWIHHDREWCVPGCDHMGLPGTCPVHGAS